MRLAYAFLIRSVLEGLGSLYLYADADSTTSQEPWPTTTIYGTTYSVVVPADTASYWGAQPTTVNGEPAIGLLSQYQSSYMMETSGGTTESIPGLAVVLSMSISIPSGQTASGCKLTIQVAGKTVLSPSISSSDGDFSLLSAAMTISGIPGFTFMEVCSTKVLSLVAYDIVLLADPQVVTITPTPSPTTSSSSSSTSSSMLTTSSSVIDTSSTQTETSVSSTSSPEVDSTTSSIRPSSSQNTIITSTPVQTTTSVSSSTSYHTTVSVDVASATLQGATTTTVNGAAAVLMTPSPTSTAEMSVIVSIENDSVGKRGALSLDITTMNTSPPRLKRADETCQLIISLDGTTVYESSVEYNTGTTTIVTDSIILDEYPAMNIREICADVGIPLVISNLALLVADPSSNTTSISSTQSGIVSVSFTSPTISSFSTTVSSNFDSISLPTTSSDVQTMTASTAATLTSWTITSSPSETDSSTIASSGNEGTSLSSATSSLHQTSSPIQTVVSSLLLSSTKPSHPLSSLETPSIISSTLIISSIPYVESLTNTNTESISRTIGSLSSTSSSPLTTATTPVEGFPSSIGSFDFFGCVGSSANYPTFDLALSSGDMSIDACTSLCGGKLYSGVYNTNCYCGDAVNSNETSIVPVNQCDTPCPGNSGQFCGGLRDMTRLRRQSAIPNNILLTVYTNRDILGGGSGPGTTTTGPLGLPTTNITETFLITTTQTVSGSVTVDVFTSTTVYCPLCPQSANPECVSNYCSINYIFEVCNGSSILEGDVFIREPCSCPGGWAYQPVTCHDTSCSGQTVYKPAPWTPPEGIDQPVYRPQICSQCPGGFIFIQAVTPSAISTTATAPPSPEITSSGFISTHINSPGSSPSSGSEPSGVSPLPTSSSQGTVPSDVVEAGSNSASPTMIVVVALICIAILEQVV